MNSHSVAVRPLGIGRYAMGQTPKELEPARSVLHFFGAEVRRLRQELDMSQADLGKALFVHKDLVRKIESAERMPSDELVERCDQVLNANGALHRLLPMLHRDRALRVARDTSSPRAGFRSEATDRPVLDWLLSSVQDARRSRSGDDTSWEAAETLQQLRCADHVHGAGRTYPKVNNLLDHELDILATGAPSIARNFLATVTPASIASASGCSRFSPGCSSFSAAFIPPTKRRERSLR